MCFCLSVPILIPFYSVCHDGKTALSTVTFCYVFCTIFKMAGSKSVSEEAVNEVKRQAMSELQKAVAEAERKAHEMISTERAKMERTVAEAKRQAAEDALSIISQQEDSSEVNIHTNPLFSLYIHTMHVHYQSKV